MDYKLPWEMADWGSDFKDEHDCHLSPNDSCSVCDEPINCNNCDNKRFVKSWLSERWEAEGANPIFINCPKCNQQNE